MNREEMRYDQVDWILLLELENTVINFGVL
jgi:hypothetical protein